MNYSYAPRTTHHFTLMRLSCLQFFILLLLALLGAFALAFSGIDLNGILGELPSGLPKISVPKSNNGSADGKFDFPVTWAQVDAVLDGDTIRLSDGNRVRYIGMDTPETESDPPECYAKEAARRNRKLVDGKRVALRKDRSETDRYGRLLRYVYLEDGRMVNELLVEEGYAVAAEFRPDPQNASRFAELEEEAHQANRGLWGKCER